MAAFLRLFFLVPIAYMAACVAAAAVLVFALIRGFVPPPSGIEVIAMLLPAIVGAASTAVLPGLLAIVLAEAFGWRSVFYWLAVGGLIAAAVITTPSLVAGVQAVAVFVVYLAWMPRLVPLENLPPTDFVTTVLAAGFVGGFVYWLVAGRWSGMNGAPAAAPPPSPTE